MTRLWSTDPLSNTAKWCLACLLPIAPHAVKLLPTSRLGSWVLLGSLPAGHFVCGRPRCLSLNWLFRTSGVDCFVAPAFETLTDWHILLSLIPSARFGSARQTPDWHFAKAQTRLPDTVSVPAVAVALISLPANTISNGESWCQISDFFMSSLSRMSNWRCRSNPIYQLIPLNRGTSNHCQCFWTRKASNRLRIFWQLPSNHYCLILKSAIKQTMNFFVYFSFRNILPSYCFFYRFVPRIPVWIHINVTVAELAAHFAPI